MTPVRTRVVSVDIASDYSGFLTMFSLAGVVHCITAVPYPFFVVGHLQSLDGCV